MAKHTIEQIATDKDLWEQYVDPNGEDPAAFGKMTIAAKMKAIVQLWPEDVRSDDVKGQKIKNGIRAGNMSGSGRAPKRGRPVIATGDEG